MRAPASFTLKQNNRTTRVLDYTQPGTALTNENTGTPVVHTLITDRLGQLIERTTTGSDTTDQQVRITYTPDGARSRLVVNGQATEYTYDEGTGLLTTLMRTGSADNAVGEKGQSQSVPSVLESLTYHYDTDAHLTHITNHTGAVLRAFNTVPTIVEAGTGGAQQADASYVTDGGWATIEHRHVDGQQQSITTYYNAEGLVIGVDDTVDGLRLLTYDDAHQLTAVMTDQGTHRFTYDTAGFLIGEETTTGVTREYTYDAAGQLVRLQDSHTGVSEYVYDGLGRRVQHTDPTGAVSTYAYSPVGLLAEITGEDRDAVYLWNDALGQVAAVATSTADTGSTGADSADDSHSTMMCTLTWDPVAFTPTVLGVNNTPVSLSALASVDAVGGRGKDPFGLSPVVTGFTAGAGSDASADAQGLFGTATTGIGSIPGVPGLGLTRAGSVQVAGLEILGARVYDATTRGFMSPDPLASPVGAGWAGNVYAFAGNDPVGQVDPWGLSPMTAAELHKYQAETHAAQASRGGGVLGAIAKHAPGFELVSALGRKVQGVMDTATDFANKASQGLSTAKNITGGLLDKAKKFGADALDDLKGRASGAWERTQELGSAAWDKTKEVTGQAWEATKSGVGAAVEWTKNNWQYLAAGAVLAGGLLLGGPIGAGIVIGFAVSGGVEFGSQAIANKGDLSKIDYKKVANASSVGGLAGGAGAGVGGLITKSIATPALETASARVAAQTAAKGPAGKLASGMFDSAVSNGVNGAGMEIFENGFKDPAAIARKGAAGLATGVLTPVGAAGTRLGLNKAFGVTSEEVIANRVTTTVGDSLSGGVFGAGNYAISEDQSKVTWDGARDEFFKGAASSGLTSDPVKSPVFEQPLQSGAQAVSPGQRATISGVSGVAVSANGLAAEELSDDQQK